MVIKTLVEEEPCVCPLSFFGFLCALNKVNGTKKSSVHLQTHVVRQEGEEMMLHVAADQRVSKDPVQNQVPG